MSIARIAALPAMVLMVSCGIGDEPERQFTKHAAPTPSGSVSVIDRRPFLPAFPCSRCHDARTPNHQERTLVEFHSQKFLNHGTQEGWCYRCHTADDIDHLHLADGTKVGFNEAYKLCGSCHGEKYRDWKDGIHGLTTGFWLGDGERRSCPACHNPHLPRFPMMTPEHPPQLPRTVPNESHPGREDGNGEEH
jgi:hypothetical protein